MDAGVGGMNLPRARRGCSQQKIAAATARIGTGRVMVLDGALNFSRHVGNEAKALPRKKSLRELLLCRDKCCDAQQASVQSRELLRSYRLRKVQ